MQVVIIHSATTEKSTTKARTSDGGERAAATQSRAHRPPSLQMPCAYFAKNKAQLPKFREGGAQVFSDEIPLFEKSGREKRLWVSQLDFLSLEADPYKKNRRLAAAYTWQGGDFFVTRARNEGITFASNS